MGHAEIELTEHQWQVRSQIVEAAASRAFGRLLHFAETSSSGQGRTVACFLAATFDAQSFQFDLFELRTVDIAISDDMLICLDALRWAKADLYKLVPDGHARIIAMCEARGLAPV